MLNVSRSLDCSLVCGHFDEEKCVEKSNSLSYLFLTPYHTHTFTYTHTVFLQVLGSVRMTMFQNYKIQT